ncbi:50S ribosomal protein L16 [Candidatus Bathyarchaeota archaeon]|nr:50S ribosomal protein L16 [Candidatus Bathyarchaeota archaeon]
MKGRNYRQTDKHPYTRPEFIHGVPPPRVSKFTMGDPNGPWEYELALVSMGDGQIRHNALEAARVATNKVVQDALGEKGYYLRVAVYPHHVLREHKVATQAGADRLSQGMKRAFGVPIGTAARVKAGQNIIIIRVGENAIPIVKEAFRRGASKIPLPTRVDVRALKNSGSKKD